MLLGISNDISLRALGICRWKSLQRWTYEALALTAAHGIAYQLVESAAFPGFLSLQRPLSQYPLLRWLVLSKFKGEWITVREIRDCLPAKD